MTRLIKKQKESARGSALAYGLIIMSVVVILLTSILQYVSSQLQFGFHQTEKERAFQVAEAGIYFYRWYLAHELAGKTAQQIRDFWEDTSPYPYGVNTDYEADFLDPGGGAIGRYRIQTVKPETGSTIVEVTSTGWTYKNTNITRTIKVRFRRPSWSEYMFLANSDLRFGENAVVNGKVHSNFGIRFDGLANNVVSSALNQYQDPSHGLGGGEEFGVHTHRDTVDPLPPNPVPSRPDVFVAGRQFPVPVVNFNGVLADLGYMKSEAEAGNGIYFDNSDCGVSDNLGRHIILKTDGTMTVRKVRNYNTGTYAIQSEGCAENYTIPDEGIIFVENNSWVEGGINDKRVTIVSANLIGGSQANVYLGMNNLSYTNFDGRDVIGIIAQNNVLIVQNSQNFLTIDAALLAQNGFIKRSSCGVKNTITINGSIATNQPSGFACVGGGGYQNRVYNFDNNLLYFPPPYFPTGTDYAIDLWEEI